MELCVVHAGSSLWSFLPWPPCARIIVCSIMLTLQILLFLYEFVCVRFEGVQVPQCTVVLADNVVEVHPSPGWSLVFAV